MIMKPITSITSADEARSIAIEWQQWQSERNLSLGDLVYWQQYFVKLAKKFNLTEEFRENSII